MATKITESGTPFVTFYSFKGGVGRSMALINVAGIMAGRGFKVLALDMDLEAPGISYLMRHEADRGDESLPGFIDLLSDACERGENADLFTLDAITVVENYSYKYSIPPEILKTDDGLLRIMPAGKFDGQYQDRLDRLNLGKLYRDGQGKPLVMAFKEIVAASKLFDFVFVDSRTGFSDESGICTRDLADYLLVVMGLNRQNEEGTAAFLRSLKVSGAKPKDMRVVLSPVPNGEDELVERREREAAERLSQAYGAEVHLSLQIPYHPRLALTEEPHIFRRSRGYLYDAYAAIEREVLAMMGVTVGNLLKRITDATAKKNPELVMQYLRHVEKLDDGAVAIGHLAMGELREMVLDVNASELRRYLASTIPMDSWIAQSLAVDLHKKKNQDAGLFYKLALKTDPANANNLGNYALFLTDIRRDHDAAEAYYKCALDADPNHPNNLGNYATFLTDIRKDHDAAEALFKRALDADPKNANNLGNYALFLKDIRKDYDAAQALYNRALDAVPSHANNLGNYANFLKRIRKDYDAAEALFKRALDANPEHPTNLGAYAVLLAYIRKNHDAAEALFKRALDNDPTHANNLGNYANFLSHMRKNLGTAEVLYKRALDAVPTHANHLANYAKLLFVTARVDEASTLLAKAWDQNPTDASLKCELYFYACAHLWKEHSEALACLKELLESGECSENWPLEENVRVAKESGHPHPDFIEALAKVVSSHATADTLAPFEAWQRGHF